MSDAAIVTFLFTDLVASSDLYSRLGDDAAEQLRRTHFRALRDAVASAGGHEVKTMGDGLMVVFPSAVDAISCAVAMQQAVDRENSRREVEPLGVRVGLHTGEPIRDEDDYFGTAVVIARRLCDAAHGGQIIASDLVRGLVGSRGGFTFQELGPLELKGVSDPIRASEVAWERLPAQPIPLPTTLSALDAAPFVAREEELARLRMAWKLAQTGQRKLVLIAGEAGIGKTRLTAQFARGAYEDGGTVLFGRCDEEVLVPYQPFVEALRQYVTTCQPDELRFHLGPLGGELIRLVPDLPGRVPGLAEPSRSEPETERYRLFEAVTSFLTSLSMASAVVLLLDDIHWADKPTLLMLRHLLRSAPTANVLIVGTYREMELGRTHPLDEALEELRRDEGVERISLDGFDEAEIGDWLARVGGTGVGRRGRRLAEALRSVTEGNPFFVQQVVGHLVETGRLFQREGEWTFDVRVDQLGLPEGVKQVIGRRLSRLSENCNAILAPASVVGRQFEFDVLTKMVDLSEDVVLSALDEALASGLVTEVPERAMPEYAFSHALVKQTLYDELHLARKQRLHLRAAEALEKVHERDVDPFVTHLATHYQLAGAAAPADKALTYSLLAAQSTAAVFAWEETAAHLEASAELMEEQNAPPAERAGLLSRLGDLMYATGLDYQKGIRYLEQSLALYEAAGDVDRAARVHSRLGRSMSSFGGELNNIPVALDHLRKALAVLAKGPEGLALGYTYIGLATACSAAAEIDEGLVASDKGMELGERLGSETLWANAAILRAIFLSLRGEFAEARELHERAWEIADRLDLVFLAWLSTQWLSAVTWDPIDTIRRCQIELSKPRSQASGSRRALLSMMGGFYAWSGDREKANDILAEIGEDDVPMRTTLSLHDGEWEAVAEQHRTAIEQMRRIGVQLFGPIPGNLSRVLVLLGRLDEAEEVAAQQVPLASDRGVVLSEFACRAVLAYIYAERGDQERATKQSSRLREILDRGEDWRGSAGRVWWAEGVVLGRFGDAQRAGEAFGRAIEVAQRYQIPWDEADALHEWGRALLRAGDRSALQKFDASIEIYRRIGAGQPWIDRVEADKARL